MRNLVTKLAGTFLPKRKRSPHIAGESIVLRSVKGGTITSIGIQRSPVVITEADRKLFNLPTDLYPIKEN